jgi:flagellar biosynthesis protein FlgN
VIDQSGFVAGLRAERDAFRALCQLLESEQACLVESDIEGLLQLTGAKSERVDRLMDLAQQRAGHLASIGLSGGGNGMSEWLAAQAGVQRAELTQLWDELVRLASNARSLNEINGKLITTRLSHNQAALSALQLSARAQNIYGPDGQAAISAGHRELGRV